MYREKTSWKFTRWNKSAPPQLQRNQKQLPKNKKKTAYFILFDVSFLETTLWNLPLRLALGEIESLEVTSLYYK